LGAATCVELGASGATVIVAGRDMAKAENMVAQIVREGGKAHAVRVDVADAVSVQAMVRFAVETTGSLYGLVNNAGISGPSAPTGEHDLGAWQQVINTNLSGVFYGMRYAIPEMVRTGAGSIVNVASILGSVGFAGAVGYVSAKHGVVGMTKSAALEYAAKGIRVNAVGPDFIHTPMVDNVLDPSTQDLVSSKHALVRMGTPEEVAALIVFLLSARASFMIDSYYLVDGGYTAQ
jgi:NAD(P)-dependent dehydrogenase (short-subunit alcohol dehydrogenase family)